MRLRSCPGGLSEDTARFSTPAVTRPTHHPLFTLATDGLRVQQNVCGYDRVARVLGGVGLLLVGIALRARTTKRRTRRIGTLTLASGVELLATAVVQWCPTNAALGVNTCEQTAPEAVRTARERLFPGVTRDGRRVAIPTPT